MKSKPNYKHATDTASRILLNQDHISTFPISPQEINLNNINNIFSTFQKYSEITGTPISSLTQNNTFTDGYTMRNIRPNTNLILYNENILSTGRINWTNSHELGHIALNHFKQCKVNEQEADAFASQLLLPKCILKKLIKENVPVTSKYIMDKFGLSEEASKNAIKSVRALLEYEHISIYDEAILIKFNDFLKNETSNFLDSFFEDSDYKRRNWNYYN